MTLAPESAPPPGSHTDSDIMTSPGPFEGPAKLLEVWFAPSPDSLPVTQSQSQSQSSTVGGNGESSTGTGAEAGRGTRGDGYRGLRTVPRAVWEEMLDIVKCKVLSVVEGDEVDAYLLRYVVPPCPISHIHVT